MPPHRVGFLCRFDLKPGIHFAHFCLESAGYGFEGTKKCTNILIIISIPNEFKRKLNMRIRNGFEWFVCLRSNLNNDNIISAYKPGLKTGMDFRGLVWKRVRKIIFFGQKSDQNLKNLASHPHQEFPGIPPGRNHFNTISVEFYLVMPSMGRRICFICLLKIRNYITLILPFSSVS